MWGEVFAVDTLRFGLKAWLGVMACGLVGLGGLRAGAQCPQMTRVSSAQALPAPRACQASEMTTDLTVV